MTNKGHLRSHHRANPWLITVLLVCNKNLLWMNHDVGIGVVTTVASAALPPCSRLDRRSCWLNNSLLRPPHSGRHRCRLLGRGYPDVNGYIAISPRPLSSRRSTRRTTTKNEASKRWTCFARLMRSRWVQSQRRVDSNERDSVHRNRLDLYVLSGQRWTYRAIRRNWEKLAKIECRLADETVTGSMGSNKTTRTLLIYSWVLRRTA